MPQERKVHAVEKSKQATIPCMHYELNFEIGFNIEKKKYWKKKASFGCICSYKVKSQDTETFCFYEVLQNETHCLIATNILLNNTY